MNLLWEREKQPLASRNCFGPYNWVSVFFCWTQPILHQTSFTSSLNGWRQNRFTPYHVLTKIQMWILYKPQNDLGKAMAPHPRTFAWKIQWTEEPGGLQSMVSLRVGQDWETSLSLFIFMHWRRKWQPTPVFLPGESQGRGSLVGCRLWGRTESDMTDVT